LLTSIGFSHHCEFFLVFKCHSNKRSLGQIVYMHKVSLQGDFLHVF
jgi:hypothetical protein